MRAARRRRTIIAGLVCALAVVAAVVIGQRQRPALQVLVREASISVADLQRGESFSSVDVPVCIDAGQTSAVTSTAVTLADGSAELTNFGVFFPPEG